ncbi:MAG: hypothetical protein EOO72_15120, partial [Myxococcaceae bacterium]
LQGLEQVGRVLRRLARELEAGPGAAPLRHVPPQARGQDAGELALPVQGPGAAAPGPGGPGLRARPAAPGGEQPGGDRGQAGDAPH